MCDKTNFLIAEYESYASVLSRIKQDEQKWISVLFLMYGAVFTFQLTDYNNTLNFKGDPSNAINLILLANIVISSIWYHQALNLRIQYYRTIGKIEEIKSKICDDHKDTYKEGEFKEWRHEKTRPCETAIVGLLILIALIVISANLALYRYPIPNNKFWQYNICAVILFTFVCILIPLLSYRISEFCKMRKIFDKYFKYFARDDFGPSDLPHCCNKIFRKIIKTIKSSALH